MTEGKWKEKAELVCKMCQVKHIGFIIPLRLIGGAFTVFQQLNEEDKRDFDQIKATLSTAFATDGFMTFVSLGNGIVERCHRAIKHIAARTRCFIMEALYWYNVTPKDDVNSFDNTS